MSAITAPTPNAPRSMPIRLSDSVIIPATVVDHDSFRQWARSDDFPEKLRVSWIGGTLWVDLEREQGYTHNDIKAEFASVLRGLARALNLGRYFTDGMFLTLPLARCSTVPDGMLLSFDALGSGRVVEVPNAQRVGVVEFVGAPDMVLEVVSNSSVAKDTVELPREHHAAGTREYWRVDARQQLRFEVLRRGPLAWQPTQLPDGWWRSDVFGREFLLQQGADRRGRPEFILEVR